jgi:hypothetical protein
MPNSDVQNSELAANIGLIAEWTPILNSVRLNSTPLRAG